MKRVCGLDVHKDSIYACILDEKEKILHQESFSTLTPDLQRMSGLLQGFRVEEVAMESTSIYWIPVWRFLEKDFSIYLVNPYFIKQLPGRKTDVKDAHWIAICLQKGLIRGSYVPGQTIQDMRQYERRHQQLRKRIVWVHQHIDTQLQRCNIRITSYAQSKSQSVRKLVKSIISGARTPQELIGNIHTRTVNKHGGQLILDSLEGMVGQSDVDMLEQYMQELELLEKQQQKCIAGLQSLCREHYSLEMELLTGIPGIGDQTAMFILCELGADMSAFLTASALVGWAGLRPKNDQSAGKVRSRRIMHGNKYLRFALIQAAWAASRTKNSRFSWKYKQLTAKGKPSQKALVAVARKLLVVIWNVLSKKEKFDPKKGQNNQK